MPKTRCSTRPLSRPCPQVALQRRKPRYRPHPPPVHLMGSCQHQLPTMGDSPASAGCSRGAPGSVERRSAPSAMWCGTGAISKDAILACLGVALVGVHLSESSGLRLHRPGRHRSGNPTPAPPAPDRPVATSAPQVNLPPSRSGTPGRSARRCQRRGYPPSPGHPTSFSTTLARLDTSRKPQSPRPVPAHRTVVPDPSRLSRMFCTSPRHYSYPRLCRDNPAESVAPPGAIPDGATADTGAM